MEQGCIKSRTQSIGKLFNHRQEKMDKSQSIKWLERYIFDLSGNEIDFSNPHYQTIAGFVFIWCLFEQTFFERKANEDIIQSKSLSSLIPNEAIIKKTHTFLNKRYITDNITNDRFQNIGFIKENKNGVKQKSKYYDEIGQYLINPQSTEQMNCACMMIAWRVRCNLFHGEKNLARVWNEDGELFEVISNYLISFF